MTTTYHQALGSGYRLDEFELTGVLGAGGFGITYRGVDQQFQREVAIKEYLPAELAIRAQDGHSVVPRSDEERENYQYGLERFLEEARILAKFDEPHIVRVHRYLEANSSAYLVMQYRNGESLSQLLNRRRAALNEEEIRRHVLPVLYGMRVVHARNYLHRDIKPSNIYLCEDGTSMLIDFGAARHALGEHSRSLIGMMTPGYAPFEQYSVSAKQGPFTDLYAFGATVYRCIANKSPVEASERLAALTEGRPDPHIRLHDAAEGNYADLLLDTVEWMLQLRPQDRPQSVDEVLQCLDAGAQPPVASGSFSFPAPVPVTRTVRTSLVEEAPTVPSRLRRLPRGPGWLGQIAIRRGQRVHAALLSYPAVRAWIQLRDKANERIREFLFKLLMGISRFVHAAWKRYETSTRVQAVVKLSALVAIFFVYAYQVTKWPLNAGDLFTDVLPDGTRGPRMVVIPRGSEQLGDGAPSLHFQMRRTFAMSANEITFDEFDRFCNATQRNKPDDHGWGRGEQPVINVSRDDAEAYARWLSSRTHRRYRLPTEAEWEYAARAGTRNNWWWGRVVGANQANCAECGSTWDNMRPAPVATFAANPFGLQDTAGNVAEWTCSAQGAKPAIQANCSSASDAELAVVRGGSWRSPANETGAAARELTRPEAASDAIGIRLAMDLSEKD